MHEGMQCDDNRAAQELYAERENLIWEALDRVAQGMSTLADAQLLAFETGSRWKPAKEMK